MKKTCINLLKTTAVLFGLNSCQDALDIMQDGTLTNEATFQTTDDLKQFLLGDVYTGLDISSQIGFTSQFTDEVGQGPSNSSLSQGTHQFYLDITNGFASSIWANNYKLINRVNRLIDASVLVASGTADADKTRLQVLAEARAIRAFAYLQLETYYSPDMKDDNALGVMIVNNVPGINQKLPRSKNADVYAVIDTDIAFAEANLNPSNSYFFINKNFINAFKARYYLYRGKYAEAKIYAQKVLNESGLVLAPANPVPAGVIGSADWHKALNAYNSTNPYVKMWNDSNPGEIIFALSRPVSGSWGNIASLYTTNSTNIGGSVTYDMGRKLFNLIDRNKNDIRRWAFIDPTSRFDAAYATNPDYKASDVIVIDKYPGKSSGTQPLRNDQKVFRLSEMYLILAECAVNDKQLSLAANYILQLRQARQISGTVARPVYANETEAWADILKERRIELAFEGHRYIDLKRIGSLAQASIDRDQTDDFDKNALLTLPNNDYRFTLPVPLEEIQGNPSIQQNPGYGN
ncbi:SusD/RagB family protein [Elizabethkingia meningoseptica]|uniref:RagB/SusD family nutrient uptake outer membrane protein n=1 Tax=Elizabethkingia meningoseptica TaxID=238 RepID=UPI0009998631|nr:RagB/SusD family nutrient uptake outer membrane protein [Elizabethkingia meningoseptica]OPC04476.1 SusD/RagB family protein [Elizabethkingia meningoseptica]